MVTRVPDVHGGAPSSAIENTPVVPSTSRSESTVARGVPARQRHLVRDPVVTGRRREKAPTP